MLPQKTENIEIVVNGETRCAPEGLKVPELLTALGVDPAQVALELNRRIVSKRDWNSTTICSGDRLEIVQFVGGG